MANRLITINVRDYLVNKPVRKRHLKISKYVRSRVAHYTKIDEKNVKISRELGALMVKSHAKSMLPLKLDVSIENGIARVSPFSADKKTAAKGNAAAPAQAQVPAGAASVPSAAPAKAQKPAPDHTRKTEEDEKGTW
jgi:hypothetical protein